MKVTLAKTAGFCFGVERAVNTVLSVLKQEKQKPQAERKPIYTYGPIVHNDTVVNKLKAQGVSVLEGPEDLEALREGIVIIRAHGVGRAVYEQLKSNGLTVIDASCPFVQKIQRLVREHTAKGEMTFLAGSPVHPEVQGIVGWAEGPVTVLPDAEAARKLPEVSGIPAFVAAQTTFNVDKFKVIVEILREKGYYVTVINTICNATFERQNEAKELAGSSDAMIVIGGSSSSNTKKLFEICSTECRNTQLIQTVEDLNFDSDEAIQSVGITAGASTPKEIIEEVLTYVRNEF